MLSDETRLERSKRIIKELLQKYPATKVYDLDGEGLHFVAEVDPVENHPEFDRAVEVIISSKAHKHLRTTQKYTVLRGSLTLYVDDEVIALKKGDTFVISPGSVHYAKSEDECWVEIYSTPGWTAKDHIVV